MVRTVVNFPALLSAGIKVGSAEGATVGVAGTKTGVLVGMMEPTEGALVAGGGVTTDAIEGADEGWIVTMGVSMSSSTAR